MRRLVREPVFPFEKELILVEFKLAYKGTEVICLIDEQDAYLLDEYKWRILKKPNGSMYVQGRKKGSTKTVLMHRVVKPHLSIVDHENRDTLDNRRDNLREGKVINNRNRSVTNPNGYHGVYKEGSKYRVKIKVNGVSKHIGYYDELEDAIKARKEAEGLYW